MGKTACIFGSTGLIGSHLILRLLDDPKYEKILVFNRTLQTYNQQKIEQIVGDYNLLSTYANQLKANEYYCCLGTTIKIAKTKSAFEYVDLQLPISIGKLAVENKVSKLLVVSSVGASSKSKNFYLNVKGRMEFELRNLGIETLYIFRPSMLLGKREQTRTGESIGKIVMKVLGFLLVGKLKKYRAITAKAVASAMVNVANGNFSNLVFESDAIQRLS